jgi:hypothetical protein
MKIHLTPLGPTKFEPVYEQKIAILKNDRLVDLEAYNLAQMLKKQYPIITWTLLSEDQSLKDRYCKEYSKHIKVEFVTISDKTAMLHITFSKTPFGQDMASLRLPTVLGPLNEIFKAYKLCWCEPEEFRAEEVKTLL